MIGRQHETLHLPVCLSVNFLQLWISYIFDHPRLLGSTCQSHQLVERRRLLKRKIWQKYNLSSESLIDVEVIQIILNLKYEIKYAHIAILKELAMSYKDMFAGELVETMDVKCLSSSLYYSVHTLCSVFILMPLFIFSSPHPLYLCCCLSTFSLLPRSV